MSRRDALTCALLFAAGCASFAGVPDAELPEGPIAIAYRTPAEAQRRVDDYDDEVREMQQRYAGSGNTTTVGTKAQLSANLNDLGIFFGSALGRQEDDERSRGRLALLYPRSGDVQVVEGPRRGSVPLAWSPDRERLLFAQPAPASTDVQLFELHVERGTIRRVTHGPPIHNQGCYGPEGRIVVGAIRLQDEGPTSRIRVSQPGGRGPFYEIAPGPGDHTPTCSPETGAVAWTRTDHRARNQIWLADLLRADEPKPIGPGHHPRFSRDGEWLVYSRSRGRDTRIFRVRVDGGARAPIGRGMRNEAWPTTSPDGGYVAYVAAEEPPRSHLYVRRFDGTGDRILFADGDAEYPVW